MATGKKKAVKVTAKRTVTVRKKTATSSAKRKTFTVSKSPALVWKQSPDSGEYTSYKLGTIFRYKGKYSYRTAYIHKFNAKSLADAKKQIDEYTKRKIGH